MLDRIFNPAPTIYKWDKFWVGFLPGLVLPFLVFLIMYGVIAVSSQVMHHETYPFDAFLSSMHSSLLFLRITTLFCIPNGLIFFFLIQRNYNNASRGVVLVTMLYVITIVIRDVS